MRVAWIQGSGAALTAALTLLAGAPLNAADGTGVHYVAEELGNRTKPADAVRQRIQQIIADQLGVPVGKITPEARLVRDLGADSLDVVELIMALEEEFAIEIRDEDAQKLVTVQDLQDYIDHARKP